MINTGEPNGAATAFVPLAIKRDILGWTYTWDEVTRSATFTDENGVTMRFTDGSPTVNRGGVDMMITNTAGMPVAARISPNSNRFIVPIRFLWDIGVTMEWMGGTPGSFSMVVTP